MPPAPRAAKRQSTLRKCGRSLGRLAMVLAFAGLLTAGAVHAQAPQAHPMPPVPGPAVPSPLQPGDAFGKEITLPERPIIYLQTRSNWDTAFDSIVDAFKRLQDFLAKQGIKPSGAAMTIYTETDDTGFRFRAAYPVAEAPKSLPKTGDIAVGEAPVGKALEFVHRGSYDAMDSTYEAITNYLDDKQLEAKDLFIEEYVSDPVTTDPNKLVVNVLVPLK